MDFYCSHFIDDKTEAIRKLRMCLPINRAFSNPCLPVNDKESACNVGDAGSIPRWARSLEEGHSNPFQCSCLENPLDRGAWQASTVHRVTKNHTLLKQLSIHTHSPSAQIIKTHCLILQLYLNTLNKSSSLCNSKVTQLVGRKLTPDCVSQVTEATENAPIIWYFGSEGRQLEVVLL